MSLLLFYGEKNNTQTTCLYLKISISFWKTSSVFVLRSLLFLIFKALRLILRFRKLLVHEDSMHSLEKQQVSSHTGSLPWLRPALWVFWAPGVPISPRSSSLLSGPCSSLPPLLVVALALWAQLQALQLRETVQSCCRAWSADRPGPGWPPRNNQDVFPGPPSE